MDGRRWPQSPSISQLTSPLETIPSCYRRSRHTKFQPHSRRHQSRRQQVLFYYVTNCSFLLPYLICIHGLQRVHSINLQEQISIWIGETRQEFWLPIGSIYLCLYESVYLSSYLAICISLSVCQSVYVSMCLCVYVSIHSSSYGLTTCRPIIPPM
jgi:hypothetical protein